MKNTVILFDIDYTLFNVGKYRQLVFHTLASFFPTIPNFLEIAEKTYEEIRQTGWFEAEKFTKQLLHNTESNMPVETLADVWKDEALLEESLYPEALAVLQHLSEAAYVLGIFSSGYLTFQKSKIAKLAHFFREEHIHIHEIKDEKLPDILEKYQGKKVFLIDDYIPVIERAKQTDPAITTIWIKRGRLSQRVAPSLESPPDFTIETLDELLPIVEEI